MPSKRMKHRGQAAKEDDGNISTRDNSTPVE